MSEQLLSEIGELNKEILRNHRTDTELFSELTEIQKELGLLYEDRPTCPFLRPHFMPRSLYESISSASHHIAEAARRLSDAALQDAELLARLDLSEREERLVRIDPRYEKLCVTSRLDTFIDGVDFKFLEYNAETPAGVGDQMQLEKVLERVPEVRQFLDDRPHWKPKPHQKLLQAMFTAYRQTGGRKGKPNIAIVDWEGVSTEAEFYTLKDYFESNGFKTLICDPRELEYDGKILCAGSFGIDIFYKRVLIHEFLEKFDDMHPLIRAYSDGNICMANSFRVKTAQKKASFAIFTDENYNSIFTNEQLETFNKHVPWTRKVESSRTNFEQKEVDLLELIRKDKDKFLLKPNDDYGGKGITLGWETAQSEWESAIEEALSDSFVVQQRVSIEKSVFPMFDKAVHLQELLVDFDPFLFLNEVEGGLVRLSSSSLVNVTQGGGQTALVVLEGS